MVGLFGELLKKKIMFPAGALQVNIQENTNQFQVLNITKKNKN